MCSLTQLPFGVELFHRLGLHLKSSNVNTAQLIKLPDELRKKRKNSNFDYLNKFIVFCSKVALRGGDFP